MNQLVIVLQIIMMILFIIYLFNNNKANHAKSTIVDKENKKEMEKLLKMRSISLTEPLTEKSRPSNFEEIIGQEEGIKALQAAICGPNPQHVIIYGPPGIGKTAAARLVLEVAKKKSKSPFRSDANFIEIDATTIRFDERGIADPLIGSVHDPIYQGAGAFGIAGIPQPKPGAVTKAHGGVLFIDEIGELHPIEMNKLLKVLEDRKVFLDSSYYSSEDPNMPGFIREIFENGLPADFRLIGATTRSPEEIAPAIRSRCVEVFFRALNTDEIRKIAENSIKKVGLEVSEKGLDIISRHCNNGREVVNLVQLCSGIAINEEREKILEEDINWVIENGQYTEIPEKKINEKPQIGVVNGLAVYGANIGMVMEIEATAKKIVGRKGELKISGIIEEEEISMNNKKVKRKSTAYSSVQNVLTVLNNVFNLKCDEFDIHINIPGGMPVDGPSAGAAISIAVYSAITNSIIKNDVAITGEISLLGNINPIGGVNAKILAAKKAGATTVIIPAANWNEAFLEYEGVRIIPIKHIKEAIDISSVEILNSKRDILSAKSK
ncbi:ATP-dependent protease LonB [Clostridium celatum]|uniref:ATP-dependent protease LonB n=1 Tax=Clostridium celatum TaxID=36834 RepID=UPI001F1B2162|nr:ATP-dependent protease LonB [Clostridium celatum]MCE9656108.1 ATP-dependent protease LonB [Clostridium celatum]MDU6294741.1 ATP-dependent protease LonB [Clostridium celatum]